MVFGAELNTTIPAITQTFVAIDDKTTFRYDRTGRELETAWREKNYDDSAWPQGKTLIADESTTTVEPIRTAISRFNDDGTYVQTFYFRTHFTFDGDLNQAKLKLRHAVDDGAVFYLNGQEINRFGIAADATYDSTTSFAGHENAYEGPFDIPISALVVGDNVLAAEVHQSGGSSSDMVFGAEVTGTFFPGGGTVVIPPGQQATVTITQKGAGVEISWSAPGTLESTDKLGTAWTTVAGASASPFAVTSPSGTKFYRLRQ